MKKYLLLALLPAACATGKVVQALTEPYSVAATVTVTDDAGNKAVKGCWLNSRYIAVDLSQIEFAFVLSGPAVYGGPIVELRRFDKTTGGPGRQAWEIVLPAKSGEKTRLVVTTWEAARASIPSIPQ